VFNALQAWPRFVLLLAQPLLIGGPTGAAQESGGVVNLKDTNAS
jgi:hypothetical protein